MARQACSYCSGNKIISTLINIPQERSAQDCLEDAPCPKCHGSGWETIFRRHEITQIEIRKAILAAIAAVESIPHEEK
jgi:hypothetical protein